MTTLIEKTGRYLWGVPWQTSMAAYLDCRVDHIQDCRQGRRRLHSEHWKKLELVVKGKVDAAGEIVSGIDQEIRRDRGWIGSRT